MPKLKQHMQAKYCCLSPYFDEFWSERSNSMQITMWQQFSTAEKQMQQQHSTLDTVYIVNSLATLQDAGYISL